MLELITTANSIPAMSEAAIERVRALEAYQLANPVPIELQMLHVLHGGTYTRTLLLPANVQITGALIKIPTTLIISGDALVWVGPEVRRYTGYSVLAASAGRKQAFRAIADTTISMIFPTQAKTVAEAEQEFTDEWASLAPGRARTIITGERA